MSVEFFLDTNILVYTFEPENSDKRRRACELVEKALYTDAGVISYQVVQEFLNVATRRFAVPMNADAARDYLKVVLEPLCAVFPSIALYELTITLRERWRFSFSMTHSSSGLHWRRSVRWRYANTACSF